jgi:hypothetical protein
MKSHRYKKNKNKSTKKKGGMFNMFPGQGDNENEEVGLNRQTEYKENNSDVKSFYGKGFLGAIMIAGVALMVVKLK